MNLGFYDTLFVVIKTKIFHTKMSLDKDLNYIFITIHRFEFQIDQ